MKSIALFASIIFIFTGLLPIASMAEGKSSATSCRLVYNMSGWSFFYKTSNGEGKITCSDGTSAEVTLRARGGGLSVGKSNIIDGEGNFSEVLNIDDLYGNYVAAEAHAGATKSAAAQAMTKGEVSLSLKGTGQGFDIGICDGPSAAHEP